MRTAASELRGENDVPANGGQLRLLLHFFGKDLQLLLERLLVVVGVDVVVVWYHRRQELGAGEAEKLLEHLQVSGNKSGGNIMECIKVGRSI